MWVAALGLGVAGLVIGSLWQSYRGFPDEVFLDLERGTGTAGIARQLSDAHIIRYRWQFLLARALRPASRLQAGEYRFAAPASVWKVFDRLVRGDVFYYEVRVPEGSNIFEIANTVAGLGVISADDFLRVASDPAGIRDLDPKARTQEGYLFPSTYRITRHTTAEQLCRQMTDQFRRQWKQLTGGEGQVNTHAVVTLASMIEKETGVPDERPLVASVLENRLAIGMALQCDPTTIYAALLDQRYRGAIHRSDLESQNSYNTYQHAGLPPGPIASPGVEALKAALHPAETKYLYFVAKPDGSGGHHFSADLNAHEQAVRMYRRGHAKAASKAR